MNSTLKTGFKGGLYCPLETLSETLAAHIRLHLPGTPAKIECDDELKAFILDRIETQTFDQIIAAIREAVPPDRRISRSSLQRWWQKHRPTLIT